MHGWTTGGRFNTFRVRFRLGLFDPPATRKWRKLGLADVDSPASQQYNTEASRQSLVLLKNDGDTLPLAVPKSGKVIVIGGSANSTRLLGGGHYARNLAHVDGFETGGFPGIPGAISAVLKSGGSVATVQYLPGIKCTARADSICADPQADAEMLAAAVAAAKAAAQVVVVVNLQSRVPCDTAKAFAEGGEFVRSLGRIST